MTLLTWLAANAGSLAVGLLLAAAVAGVLYSLHRDKKRGKSSCGGHCGSCPMGGACHGGAAHRQP